MTYNRWKHPDNDDALILEAHEDRQVAVDHLCPDKEQDQSLLTSEPVEMTPEEFGALGEFEG